MLVITPAGKRRVTGAARRAALARGETAEETAAREVREETGVDGRRSASALGDVSLLLPPRRPADPQDRHTSSSASYVEGSTADHDHEVDDARWIPLAGSAAGATLS